MTAHTADIDGPIVIADRDRIGVGRSAASLLEYDLTVIASDAEDVVRAAGGWLCDRVLAGWKVGMFTAATAAPAAAGVLGVRLLPADTDLIALVRSTSAALAISAEFLDANEALRAEVLRAVDRSGLELTVWGTMPAGALAGRLAINRHRLSGAARAFKSHALAASGSSCTSAGLAEEFRSCGSWYPPEGPDLTPVS
ncbi:hypothetical protein [Mycolicibacterium mucogenicum]|uniref:Uncharacterized protein n=1 Tax=Mycolicibacterium mucogenicum DSM 44124 TaxID=1226753 RepID=A0A8H2PGQ1_MYCMU|nr:hypothetical protein [Mycolicibacterium mucogenicum]KAB7758055.1 hypothetical protein MMUC44124_12720 [Mycolicibacterium mucogenicum DSM 44124]QPG71481.1 hypothetical protein C1S78_011440 [Mycolicibacterium mucogenicum DSM 44124]